MRSSLTLALVAGLLAPPMGLLASSTGSALSFPRAAVVLEPTEVRTDISFDGARVKVLGSVVEGYQVAVLCRGPATDLELKKKGKVLGVLWMSVGDVHLENVPSLYLLATSGPLAGLAAARALEALGLGYDAIGQASLNRVPAVDRPMILGQLRQLKEREQLFAVREGAVRLEPGAGGTRLFQVECPLPSRIPQGDYEVQVFGFRDGRGELVGSAPLRVRPRGITGAIATLVAERPLLHGILAVIIAIVAGLLCAVMFGRGSQKGH